jgi:hypothetical protein
LSDRSKRWKSIWWVLCPWKYTLKAEHLIINLWCQKYDTGQLPCKYDSSGDENLMITKYCFENMLISVGAQVSRYLSWNC